MSGFRGESDPPRQLGQEDPRRADRYWIEQLEAGISFVQAAYDHPVEETLEPLVDIEAAAKELDVELEFSATPHVGGRPRLYLARRSVAARLLAVAAEFRAVQHTLIVEDAFRTYEMQRDLALADGVVEGVVSTILAAEPDASPEVIIERLSVVVQTRPKGAGHMAGAAVDVSVRDPDGSLLCRGGPYLTVSEATPMKSPFISNEARENRRFITETMARHGFYAFPFEFWHYSCDDIFARLVADDPTPAHFGPVELAVDGTMSPIGDQLALMHHPEILGELVAKVIRNEAGRMHSRDSK